MRPQISQLYPNAIPGSPGEFKDWAELQKWIARQKFTKSFQFQTVTGAQVFDTISFPGTARWMHGLVIFDTSRNVLNQLTLSINNDIVIQDGSWITFSNIFQQPAGASAVGNNFNGQYYSFPRPISGNDSVQLTYNAATAGVLNICFWYSQEGK